MSMKTKKWSKVYLIILLVWIPFFGSAKKNNVTIYPMPRGEKISTEYAVSVAGRDVPVYIAKVAPLDKQKRWDAMDKRQCGEGYYDIASFAYFDLNEGKAKITVTVPEHIDSVKVLPSSYGIKPDIKGNKLSFTVSSPQNLTIEVNGEWIRSLHLFVNGPEQNIPDPNDPNVIFYGPGIHEITHVEVGDNKTVYVAGGAVVRLTIGADEPFHVSKFGLKGYSKAFWLKGNNITFRGRGILDASACTVHSRHMIGVRGENIRLEGVILRDAPLWTVPVDCSKNVVIDNIKLLGRRANSDGIDICSSENVLVKNCFIRTLDDLIVLKTPRGMKDMKHIRVEKCVLWNQMAHSLSIGAEITQPIDDVLFTDCDIIHDIGREWALRVYHTDKALVTNVRFEDIRIEECNRLMSVWIGKDVWTTDPEPGRIDGVTFRNITAFGKTPNVEVVGFDEMHKAKNILFENIHVNGRSLIKDDVSVNKYSDNVMVK